jgi:hypothetical protein
VVPLPPAAATPTAQRHAAATRRRTVRRHARAGRRSSR